MALVAAADTLQGAMAAVGEASRSALFRQRVPMPLRKRLAWGTACPSRWRTRSISRFRTVGPPLFPFLAAVCQGVRRRGALDQSVTCSSAALRQNVLQFASLKHVQQDRRAEGRPHGPAHSASPSRDGDCRRCRARGTGLGAAGEFDLAWSMESGEHMPDKQKFVGELVRVTAPGGRVLIVTWCHRVLQPGEAALQPREQALLDRRACLSCSAPPPILQRHCLGVNDVTT